MKQDIPGYIFDFPSDDGTQRHRLCFGTPDEILCAQSPDEVRSVLQVAETRARSGAWVAGYVSYDAAPAFDPALTLSSHDKTWPLVWFGVFHAPLTEPASTSPLPASMSHSDWQPGTERIRFNADIGKLREHIRCGDAYQINHTFRLHRPYTGDALSWFARLCAAQPVSYCAYLSLDHAQQPHATGRHILSISPELFFRREGDRITTRPMKGTAPRGRWAQEDQQHADALLHSEKNRAENLMIVDLLRNDLSRIALPHSVAVSKLFSLECHPTLWQMTSTIQATTRPGISLEAIFAALFPCGSITGAPKTKAMELIAQTETEPRGIYCGAIGLIKPGGDAIFNVAIRTVTLQNQQATCGVGGAITWDSTAEDEYSEAMLKARFLNPTDRIRLHTPTLIETLRLENGAYWLLERHLERLKNSARYFNQPCDLAACRLALEKLAREHSHGLWRIQLQLRLQPSLDLKAGGELTTRIFPFPVTPQHATFALSRHPVPRHADWLHHKTTQRDFFDHALHDALSLNPDCFDVLLWNEAGELTEFTRGNLVLEIEGTCYTPPQEAGLLDGVLRRELLETGHIKERTLTLEDLHRATRILLINSLRGEIDMHKQAGFENIRTLGDSTPGPTGNFP